MAKNRFFGKLTNKAKRILEKRKSQNIIVSLHNRSEGNVKLIVDAFQKTLLDQPSESEKELISKIEKLRSTLLSSKKEIKIEDFGAGSAALDSENRIEKRTYNTLIVKDICKAASKPYIWSFLLFNLVREFKPQTCIELGTSLGISASYEASALKLNGSGNLITMEGAKEVAEIAKDNFRSLCLDNIELVEGLFHDTLKGVLDENRPIDYAFIDGHHDEFATEEYFQQIYSFLSDEGLVIFDDIAWSDGMKRVWKKIEGDQRVKISFNMGGGWSLFD